MMLLAVLLCTATAVGKQRLRWSCAADYGSSTPCCGQQGDPVEVEYQCPQHAPICAHYVFGQRNGLCTFVIPAIRATEADVVSVYLPEIEVSLRWPVSCGWSNHTTTTVAEAFCAERFPGDHWPSCVATVAHALGQDIDRTTSASLLEQQQVQADSTVRQQLRVQHAGRIFIVAAYLRTRFDEQVLQLCLQRIRQFHPHLPIVLVDNESPLPPAAACEGITDLHVVQTHNGFEVNAYRAALAAHRADVGYVFMQHTMVLTRPMPLGDLPCGGIFNGFYFSQPDSWGRAWVGARARQLGIAPEHWRSPPVAFQSFAASAAAVERLEAMGMFRTVVDSKCKSCALERLWGAVAAALGAPADRCSLDGAFKDYPALHESQMGLQAVADAHSFPHSLQKFWGHVQAKLDLELDFGVSGTANDEHMHLIRGWDVANFHAAVVSKDEDTALLTWQ